MWAPLLYTVGVFKMKVFRGCRLLCLNMAYSVLMCQILLVRVSDKPHFSLHFPNREAATQVFMNASVESLSSSRLSMNREINPTH